ncbi:MAG: T9SS type A sorting domain-containing protein [Taibaiella sp.]|nr:T9SS type A sorting domain-containing protein [Taibaiella sp.]
MKKIFTSVAVIAACAVGASAQKNVDLALDVTSHTQFGSYPNVAAGDSIEFTIKISNSGTQAVEATDTLTFWMLGYTFNRSENFTPTYLSRRIYGFNIPAGQSQDYTFSVINGGGVIIDGDTIQNIFIPNDTNTLIVEVYGRDQSGTLFNDPGVDNSNPDADGALTSNNAVRRDYILGTPPTSVKDLFSKKTEALNVYPNPSNGNVNVKHALTTATEVSVKVTDIAGRVVFTQNYGKQAAGEQTFNMNLANFANGVYAIELTAGSQRATSKITIKK